jgi:hypothetical protein
MGVPLNAVNPFPKCQSTMNLGHFASQTAEFAKFSVARTEVRSAQRLENTGNLGNAKSKKGLTA